MSVLVWYIKIGFATRLHPLRLPFSQRDKLRSMTSPVIVHYQCKMALFSVVSSYMKLCTAVGLIRSSDGFM